MQKLFGQNEEAECFLSIIPNQKYSFLILKINDSENFPFTLVGQTYCFSF